MPVGTETVKTQNGYIGSGVAALAGARLADGSKPQHAGQAGRSKGGKLTHSDTPHTVSRRTQSAATHNDTPHTVSQNYIMSYRPTILPS